MKVILNLTHNAPSFEKGRLGWIALTRHTDIKRCIDPYAQREKGLLVRIDQSKMTVFVLTEWH